MLTVRTTSKFASRQPLAVHRWALPTHEILGPRPKLKLVNQISIAPVRHYAQKPPGGMSGGPGGFPGFNMFGQQHEKGDALKQFVSGLALQVL